MNFKLFLGGVGFLFVAFFIYRYFLKNEKPFSEETNWEGMTTPNYIGLWGAVISCFIVGIAFILNSLPKQI